MDIHISAVLGRQVDGSEPGKPAAKGADSGDADFDAVLASLAAEKAPNQQDTDPEVAPEEAADAETDPAKTQADPAEAEAGSKAGGADTGPESRPASGSANAESPDMAWVKSPVAAASRENASRTERFAPEFARDVTGFQARMANAPALAGAQEQVHTQTASKAPLVAPLPGTAPEARAGQGAAPLLSAATAPVAGAIGGGIGLPASVARDLPGSVAPAMSPLSGPHRGSVPPGLSPGQATPQPSAPEPAPMQIPGPGAARAPDMTARPSPTPGASWAHRSPPPTEALSAQPVVQPTPGASAAPISGLPSAGQAAWTLQEPSALQNEQPTVAQGRPADRLIPGAATPQGQNLPGLTAPTAQSIQGARGRLDQGAAGLTPQNAARAGGAALPAALAGTIGTSGNEARIPPSALVENAHSAEQLPHAQGNPPDRAALAPMSQAGSFLLAKAEAPVALTAVTVANRAGLAGMRGDRMPGQADVQGDVRMPDPTTPRNADAPQTAGGGAVPPAKDGSRSHPILPRAEGIGLWPTSAPQGKEILLSDSPAAGAETPAATAAAPATGLPVASTASAPAAPTAGTQPDMLPDPMAEPGPDLSPLSALAEPRQALTAATAQAPVVRADHPHLPAHLADILVQNGGQKVDIALRPEELGQVRLSMSFSDAGATVTISAERPETLDLMRRHAEALADALRALGHGSVGFEFEQQQSQPGQQASGPAGTGPEQPGTDSQTEQPTALPPTRGIGGLDIRL